MFLHQPLHTPDLIWSKSTAADEPDRIEPELGDVVIPFDVDVRRLLTITCIKETTVWACSQDGGHGIRLILSTLFDVLALFVLTTRHR